MKIAAIIAEYNPFHNGHKYQIDKIKEQGYSIIVLMSSSFTQRGEPAIVNKFLRSEMALRNGADLVLELPSIYCTSNAEIFAKGSVFILDSLNVVDNLFFGSENNLIELSEITDLIIENKDYIDKKIKFELNTGKSFLKAREASYDFLNYNQIEMLKKPNNILALEYLKALGEFNSQIQPKSIKRKSVRHNSKITKAEFSSASNIRNLILSGDLTSVEKFMPQSAFNILKNSTYNNFNNYFDILKYIILKNDLKYSNYFDYENGLENRFLNNLNSKDIYSFINSITSKRYTKSRISRLLVQILLDLDKFFILKSFAKPYIRILGSNEIGFNIIKEIKKENYIIEKFSNINKLPAESIIKQIALKEKFSTNIYNIITNNNINEDYFKNYIILKKELGD
ncbi:nucleotidyltransferase [Anaerosphaera multitolerans]|uniref:tRNA(Met) cytidine acetate ligase n=1 Tax=Anaerosphaera multitolerans TaxID=2487351 RepID=A0A437S7D2_9FIRM|nr:nucleotidyltransferase [Anaerosphaera multitolerans]RVU54894.1 nucleotidyltransferase [Anaerosphaera multitolerans]